MSMTWIYFKIVCGRGTVGLDPIGNIVPKQRLPYPFSSITGKCLIMIVSQYGFMEVVKMEGIGPGPESCGRTGCQRYRFY